LYYFFMPFCNLDLARRLEGAEGHACAEFAEARGRLFPATGSEWIREHGAYIVYDGSDSPITQTFGLGVFEELADETLDSIEDFYRKRSSPVHHEVSPLAGVPAYQLLCRRDYQPIEISSVMFRGVENPADTLGRGIAVRVVAPEEVSLWADVSARGWSHEHPELVDFLREFGGVMASRPTSLCFLAESDGVPGAAGVLIVHEGVALFGGAATVPELRCRGLQAALLQERMRYAYEHGADLAMMVAEAGSNSQRNAERRGFRIAYTRTKWKLMA
jgi:hypothetical protein